MPWTNSQFAGELTIPTGATTGQRITINHNNDGAIKVYDAANVLIAEISVTADVIKALDATGSYAKLDPSAVNSISYSPAPGLVLSRPTGDVEPASLTQYDDGFDHGLYIRSSSPIAPGQEGIDYSAVRLVGRYSTDPTIVLVASGPNSFIAINNTIFDLNGEILSYPGPHSYTPVLGNDGTATYSIRTGRYWRIGPLIYMNAFFSVNAAGSGAGTLTLTSPTNIDRVQRQFVDCHAEGLTGNSGSIQAVAFTGGSGTVFDRVRNSTGANMTGASLTANGLLDFVGWYREEV